MFPEITRDDIFRLETQRLWLRWPRAADGEAIAQHCSDPDVALNTANIPHPYALADAERFVFEPAPATRWANSSCWRSP